MNSDIILETRAVSKFFRDPVDFQALKDISFKISRGQFVSIVGSSGSGKSTLLYLLSTLDTDYEGEILIDNEPLHEKSKNQLAEIRNEKIGFVFQFHYLLPEFTVLDNVMLPALKLGKYDEDTIRKHAYEKLDLLGLGDQAIKKASKLSGGQQQRAAIARALINNPSIIFGDEPTGNLDSKNAQTVFDIFRELQLAFNQTILVVTHDAQFAGSTDRRITLKDGELLSDEMLK
ncbi:MAG: ABC transporter ATP-binding protein [Bacteroidetes bacterium]|jgi:lipoprotein-releasing system ATP-binding protein|nr:ABC transporter ATP-binding protein [Bacteroidota bacterium]